MGKTIEEIRRRDLAALERYAWPGGAAEILGLNPTTLDSRMKKLGIRRPR